jgi:hypothetical protein
VAGTVWGDAILPPRKGTNDLWEPFLAVNALTADGGSFTVFRPSRREVDVMGTILRMLSCSLMAAAAVVLLSRPCVNVSAAEPVDAAKPAEKLAEKPAFDKIVFTDSGGFTGRGSGRNLAVDADGKITAPIAGQLKPDELAELKKRLAAVEWSKVDPRYAVPGAADIFVIHLKVTSGNKTIETSVDDMLLRPSDTEASIPAKVQPPKPLVELLRYLDELYRDRRPKPAPGPATVPAEKPAS